MRRPIRKKHGAQIVELGPSLIFLLLLILFPMINLLNIVLAYGAGWYCNHLVTREVAATKPQNYSTACSNASGAWVSSGLCRFVTHSPNYNPSLIQNDVTFWNTAQTQITDLTDGTNIASCKVITKIDIQPFLNVPLLGAHVPGLNAPFPMTWTAQRPQEEKGID